MYGCVTMINRHEMKHGHIVTHTLLCMYTHTHTPCTYSSPLPNGRRPTIVEILLLCAHGTGVGGGDRGDHRRPAIRHPYCDGGVLPALCPKEGVL